jgi:Lysophospholipase L1 and related esterases
MKKKVFGIIIAIVAVVAIAGYIIDVSKAKKEEPKPPISIQEEDKEPVKENEPIASTGDKAIQGTKNENVSNPVPSPTAEPTSKKEANNLKSDFSNAIFIGDSITYGFTQAGNNPVPKENVYAKIGGHVFEGAKFLGSDKELIQRRCKGSVDYVFIMFGANDYGYEMNSYKSGYKQLIHTVRGMFPNTKIVVQSVMPMSDTNDEPNRSAEPDKLNKVVKEISKEENVQYLDILSSIPNLKQMHVPDGLHFKAELYPLWVNVIKNNVV